VKLVAVLDDVGDRLAGVGDPAAADLQEVPVGVAVLPVLNAEELHRRLAYGLDCGLRGVAVMERCDGGQVADRDLDLALVPGRRQVGLGCD